ncbi:NAD(P)-dependent dehydrogenase (short-subunit alcohol dehydrogenase family) [Salibacterium salarium]|uniref:SDR family oxidoreductase n=1 Tax=Salibacterium salarium TaxID=284579 RepID=UPI00277F1597|nr:SDR family NAD(P)-dependent oxidoreductase [Salibacterium salarium]MDQ0300099.1 NAD(P)-dependent dehydrogenase (short-subunit alcohol dehydrogenase family) [Salibacterium salarium]
MFADSLHPKVALITGGGSGIGRATAHLFAKAGIQVGILDKNIHKAAETKKEIEQVGGNAIAIEADFNYPNQLKQGFDQLIEHFGRLDILFANGGIAGVMAPIETMEVEEWDQTINTDLRGTFLSVKYAIPFLKKRGGSIIITSSMSGNRVFSQTGFTAYSTAKAGQVAFMKMAAQELSSYHIRVNAVCPGGVKTDFKHSLERTSELETFRNDQGFTKKSFSNPAKPEQISELVLFLASDHASHITGTDISIDGGESLGI